MSCRWHCHEPPRVWLSRHLVCLSSGLGPVHTLPTMLSTPDPLEDSTPTPHANGSCNDLVSGSPEPTLNLFICPQPTVTGESPPSLSKELSSTLAGVSDVSFDSDHQFPLDELKIDPLTLDGLHMLNDPDMVLADPATEDTFRMDRL